MTNDRSRQNSRGKSTEHVCFAASLTPEIQLVWPNVDDSPDCLKALLELWIAILLQSSKLHSRDNPATPYSNRF